MIDSQIQQLVDAVKQHATDHYTDGGWDVVVEAWSDEQIADTLRSFHVPPNSKAKAIAAVGEVVGVYADRQADAAQYRESDEEVLAAWKES